MLFSRSHQHCLLIHFCALIPFFFHLAHSQGNICRASIPTIHYVKRCPSSKGEWDTAARKKKCFYVGQNCTETAKFKYHCLMNSNETRLLEVCTMEWLLNGYCPIFYEKDAAIDNNFKRDCKEYEENSCPGQYISTQAYKYRRCFVLKSDSSSTSPVSKTRYSQTVTIPIISSSSTIARPDERSTTEVLDSQKPVSTNTLISIIIILSFLVVAAVVGALIFCIVKCRRELKRLNGHLQLVSGREIGIVDETMPLQESSPHTTSACASNHRYINTAVTVDNQRKGVRDATFRSIGEKGSSLSDGEYITAAIDIGAIHTKLAFAYFSRQSANDHSPQIRTLVEESVILFDKDKTFIAFGSKAIHLYLKSNNPEELYFIRNFTMKTTVPLKQDVWRWHAADQKGRNIPVLDVYTETIKFLTTKIRGMVEKSFRTVKNFRWVLTFPASWETVGENFFTQAAHRAGIPDSDLCLTTEYDSAFEWLMSVYQSKAHFEKSKCIFVDLGGGSTKIYTEHEQLKVISEPNSGGITLLKEFKHCLHNVFGRKFVEAYKTNQREDFYKLFSTFVELIHKHEPASADTVSIDIEKMISVHNDVKNTYVEKFGVCILDGKLIIPQVKLLTFFETCKAQIKRCIDAVITNLPEDTSDVKVYVFGGFSHSDIIFQYITEEFQRNSVCCISKIQEPENAIVRGAVIRGGSYKTKC